MTVWSPTVRRDTIKRERLLLQEREGSSQSSVPEQPGGHGRAGAGGGAGLGPRGTFIHSNRTEAGTRAWMRAWGGWGALKLVPIP